jgi:hypothetical protein
VRVVKVDSAKANKCWWEMYQLMQFPWLSYTLAQPSFKLLLFRQHRRILRYRISGVCFHAIMANVAGYTFAARLCEAEAGGVTPP